jgi:hypothetical protein
MDIDYNTSGYNSPTGDSSIVILNFLPPYNIKLTWRPCRIQNGRRADMTSGVESCKYQCKMLIKISSTFFLT